MDIVITILLVLLATVLLAVEIVLIPGFGVTGVLGVVSMLASVFYAFFFVGNVAGWVTIIATCIISVSLILWALYGKSLDRLALNKKINSTVKDDASKFAVGDKGVTKTRLALIGEAYINGNVVEVKSETGFIGEGEDVEIIRIAGGDIYVKRVNGK